MDNRKVADAYWGVAQTAGPPGPIADVAQLGPPPRTLERPALAYLKRATRSWSWLWITLSILFGWPIVLFPLLGQSIGVLLNMMVLPLLFIGLSVWSVMRTRERRAQLRFVLTEGQLLAGKILSIRAREYRGRFGQVVHVRYHVHFLVEGREIELVSDHDGLSLLQVGLVEPVVWHPNVPDVVVPAFLLTC